MTHSCLTEIARRREAIDKALASGSLSSKALTEHYAYVYKDGILGMGHSGSVEPQESTADYTVFTVTTLDEDRDGDTVIPMGWYGENYARNPLWFFGHQEWEIPIGTSRAPDGRICCFPEATRMKQWLWWDKGDPDAMFLKGKYDRGIMTATSIAFVPLKAFRKDDIRKGHQHEGSPGGWVFEEWDHTETSVVGVPSNPHATNQEKQMRSALRDEVDRDASYITPRLRKALLANYCTKSINESGGCWTGWCPLPPKSKAKGCSCAGTCITCSKKSKSINPALVQLYKTAGTMDTGEAMDKARTIVATMSDVDIKDSFAAAGGYLAGKGHKKLREAAVREIGERALSAERGRGIDSMFGNKSARRKIKRKNQTQGDIEHGDYTGVQDLTRKKGSIAQDIASDALKEHGDKAAAIAAVKAQLAKMSTANAHRWHWERALQILQGKSKRGRGMTTKALKKQLEKSLDLTPQEIAMAHLYETAKGELDYITNALNDITPFDPQSGEPNKAHQALKDHLDQTNGRLEAIKAMFSEHSEKDIDELVKSMGEEEDKGFETSGDGVGETGEAVLVDRGEVPDDSVEAEAEEVEEKSIRRKGDKVSVGEEVWDSEAGEYAVVVSTSPLKLRYNDGKVERVNPMSVFKKSLTRRKGYTIGEQSDGAWAVYQGAPVEGRSPCVRFFERAEAEAFKRQLESGDADAKAQWRQEAAKALGESSGADGGYLVENEFGEEEGEEVKGMEEEEFAEDEEAIEEKALVSKSRMPWPDPEYPPSVSEIRDALRSMRKGETVDFGCRGGSRNVQRLATTGEWFVNGQPWDDANELASFLAGRYGKSYRGAKRKSRPGRPVFACYNNDQNEWLYDGRWGPSMTQADTFANASAAIAAGKRAGGAPEDLEAVPGTADPDDYFHAKSLARQKSEIGSEEWAAEEAMEPQHMEDEDDIEKVDPSTEEILERYEQANGHTTQKTLYWDDVNQAMSTAGCNPKTILQVSSKLRQVLDVPLGPDVSFERADLKHALSGIGPSIQGAILANLRGKSYVAKGIRADEIAPGDTSNRTLRTVASVKMDSSGKVRITFTDGTWNEYPRSRMLDFEKKSWKVRRASRARVAKVLAAGGSLKKDAQGRLWLVAKATRKSIAGKIPHVESYARQLMREGAGEDEIYDAIHEMWSIDSKDEQRKVEQILDRLFKSKSLRSSRRGTVSKTKYRTGRIYDFKDGTSWKVVEVEGATDPRLNEITIEQVGSPSNFTTVTEQEMDRKTKALRTKAAFKEGDRVVVTSGPGKGIEGTVTMASMASGYVMVRDANGDEEAFHPSDLRKKSFALRKSFSGNESSLDPSHAEALKSCGNMLKGLASMHDMPEHHKSALDIHGDALHKALDGDGDLGEAVGRAVKYLKSLADAPDVPEHHKAALAVHGKAAAKVYKAMTPVEEEDEVAEEKDDEEMVGKATSEDELTKSLFENLAKARQELTAVKYRTIDRAARN